MADEYPQKSLFEKVTAIRKGATVKGVGDSTETVLSMGQVNEIRDLVQSEIRANYVRDGLGFQILEDARVESGKRVVSMFKRAVEGRAADGFYNPETGIGTDVDPGMFNTASVPLSLSPDEATGIYASGGIPAKIIDKKSDGILLNGYTFDGLEEDDSKALVEYAEELGFSSAIIESNRDGHIYGGSLLVPVVRGDNPITYLKTQAELIADGLLKQNCIERFWTADRWNAVLVPDFNLSARSFMNPKSFFVPMAGLEVKTSRMAVIRPKKLPYWGVIRQVGWGVSDIEGWMRSILAYEIAIMAIPTMAQQISLMYHHIPLDGIIAQNGADFAKAFAEANNETMRNWSMLNPKTMNSLGEIKILDRTYTGYWDLIKILQEDVGAKSDISNNILFHQQPKGFGENEKDVTMNQSEVTKQCGNIIASQLKSVVQMLAISCFGPDAPQVTGPNLGKIKINFNPPQIVTNEERSEQGKIFVDALKALVVDIKLPGKSAIALAQALIPGVDVPADILKDFEELDGVGESEPLGGEFGGLLKGVQL